MRTATINEDKTDPARVAATRHLLWLVATLHL